MIARDKSGKEEESKRREAKLDSPSFMRFPPLLRGDFSFFYTTAISIARALVRWCGNERRFLLLPFFFFYYVSLFGMSLSNLVGAGELIFYSREGYSARIFTFSREGKRSLVDGERHQIRVRGE